MVLCIGTFNVYEHLIYHCAGEECGFALWLDSQLTGAQAL